MGSRLRVNRDHCLRCDRPAGKSLQACGPDTGIPFLDYDGEICKVLCSTNAMESLNAPYRRAIKACGHFRTSRRRERAGIS